MADRTIAFYVMLVTLLGLAIGIVERRSRPAARFPDGTVRLRGAVLLAWSLGITAIVGGSLLAVYAASILPGADAALAERRAHSYAAAGAFALLGAALIAACGRSVPR